MSQRRALTPEGPWRERGEEGPRKTRLVVIIVKR